MVPNSVTLINLERRNSRIRCSRNVGQKMFSAIYHLWRYWRGITPSESAGASPDRKQWGGQKARVGLMASAEREPITGVWRQSPHSGVQGHSPWSGVQGAKPSPPEAERILPLDHPNEGQNLPLQPGIFKNPSKP